MTQGEKGRGTVKVRTMVSWENQETAAVVRWLNEEKNKGQLTRLVEVWNDLELLGVDLAEQIRKLTEGSAPRLVTEGVDWNGIAEHYAEEICGVDEEELTRRRIALGGDE